MSITEVEKHLVFMSVDPSINGTAIAFLQYVGDWNTNHKFQLISKSLIELKNQKAKYQDSFMKKIDVFHLFKYAVDKFMEEYGATHNVGWAVFENYSYGSPGKLADLGEMGGLFKYLLYTGYENPITVDVIPPQTVKKIIAGSGRAGKDEVRDALSQYLVDFEDINFNTLDESDACAVGIAHFIKSLGSLTE